MKRQNLKKMATNERIQFFRKELGLTQLEMGAKIGKNRQWLANLENRRPLSVANAFILADFFKISLDLLLRGKK